MKLIWDDSDPKEWFILLLEEKPDTNSNVNADNITSISGGDTIVVSDITEVMLETDPSISFRLYIGSDVIRFTPIESSRETVKYIH